MTLYIYFPEKTSIFSGFNIGFNTYWLIPLHSVHLTGIPGYISQKRTTFSHEGDRQIVKSNILDGNNRNLFPAQGSNMTIRNFTPWIIIEHITFLSFICNLSVVYCSSYSIYNATKTVLSCIYTLSFNASKYLLNSFSQKLTKSVL